MLAFLLSSCITTTKTARTAATGSDIKSVTVADLNVADRRVTYTLRPSKEIQRAGLSNIKQAAIQEALNQNGNADVMLEPEFVIEQERTLLGKRVNAITVSGRPAYYANFRKLDDAVWATPGFYGKDGAAHAVGSKGGRNYGFLNLFGSFLGKFADRSQRVGSRSSANGAGLRKTGFAAYVNLSGGYEYTRQKAYGSHHTTDGAEFAGVLGTVGMQATPNWFFGVGSGYMYGWDFRRQTVPVFADARYYLSPARNALFVDFKLGGSIEVGGDDMNGGVYAAPSVGYSFGAFEMAVQYSFHQLKDSPYKENVSRVGLTLGVRL